MKQIDIKHPGSLKETKDMLSAGKILAFPTDTVYGIGCTVTHTASVRRMYAIKGREFQKAIPILIGDIRQLELITKHINTCATQLADHFWPGALTLIIEKNQDIPEIISPYPTVGIRMPDHNWLRELIVQIGPLAVTSANKSGQPSCDTPREVEKQIGNQIDGLINGGICRGGNASTVVDCSQSQMKILRLGDITEKMIASVLIKNNK